MENFNQTFSKTSIKLSVRWNYDHTKFGLVWIKGSRVMDGDRFYSPWPQVENVLNLPLEERPRELSSMWKVVQ